MYIMYRLRTIHDDPTLCHLGCYLKLGWNILFLTGFVVAMLEPLHTTKRIFWTNSGLISGLWVRAVYVAPMFHSMPSELCPVLVEHSWAIFYSVIWHILVISCKHQASSSDLGMLPHLELAATPLQGPIIQAAPLAHTWFGVSPQCNARHFRYLHRTNLGNLNMRLFKRNHACC
jgi:hypothetical protein